MDPQELKKEFLEIFQQKVSRDGADAFLEWLERTDFFTAPASTRFHCAFPGGLCYHSLMVYKVLT